MRTVSLPNLKVKGEYAKEIVMELFHQDTDILHEQYHFKAFFNECIEANEKLNEKSIIKCCR